VSVLVWHPQIDQDDVEDVRLGEREPGFRRVGADNRGADVVEIFPKHVDGVAMIVDDEDHHAIQGARRRLSAHGQLGIGFGKVYRGPQGPRDPNP